MLDLMIPAVHIFVWKLRGMRWKKAGKRLLHFEEILLEFGGQPLDQPCFARLSDLSVSGCVYAAGRMLRHLHKGFT